MSGETEAKTVLTAGSCTLLNINWQLITSRPDLNIPLYLSESKLFTVVQGESVLVL